MNTRIYKISFTTKISRADKHANTKEFHVINDYVMYDTDANSAISKVSSKHNKMLINEYDSKMLSYEVIKIEASLIN